MGDDTLTLNCLRYISAFLSFSRPPSPSYRRQATSQMQAAVHQMPPQLLPQYSHPSHRPPLSNIGAMPTPPVTARKRKRQQFTVTYSEVHEVDSSGKVREVIVIDDTPPPSTVSPATTHTAMYSASYQPPVYSAPIRTRARAAAEAQALSASTSSGITVAPTPKKRKRDLADDIGSVSKKAVTNGHLSNAIATNKSFASGSGAVVDDVCGSTTLYIVQASLIHLSCISGVKGAGALRRQRGSLHHRSR